MKVFPVPTEWSRTLCVVSDVAENEREAFLTPDELTRLRGFARERRQMEWSASRIAVKLLAIGRGLCSDPKHCSVTSSYQKPVLRIGDGTDPYHVSISHSSGAGAAAIDRAPIGIDIQKLRDIKPRATKFFLKETELEQLDRTTVPNRMIHFWCAKEAAYKLKAGRGWLKRVTIDLRDQSDEGLSFSLSYPVEGTVNTFWIGEDFIAAVARQLKPQ